jgi:hypothetical protein
MKPLEEWVKHYYIYELELARLIIVGSYGGKPLGLCLRQDLASSVVKEYAEHR